MTVVLDRAGADSSTWVDVCGYDDLLPERGVRALVDDDHVAVFRTYDGEVHSLSDIDPFSGASVLSRGIVGTRDDVPVVASPMFKQAFDLRTGSCLDVPDVQVPVFATRIVDGRVQVARR
jgi:nitrite reductase (NADH) small subunit